MRSRLTNIVFILLIIFISFELSSAQGNVGFKIIVNKKNKNESLTKEQLEKIFLKKETKWDNAEKILPVDLIESSKTREYFTDLIHDKRVSAIKAYWQKQIFTGRGVPPPEKSSEKEVLKYVDKNEGAIGYISIYRSIKKYDVIEIEILD